MHSTIGFRMIVVTLALAVGPLTQLAPSHAQTPGSERRQDREMTAGCPGYEANGREDARDAKAECKVATRSLARNAGRRSGTSSRTPAIPPATSKSRSRCGVGRMAAGVAPVVVVLDRRAAARAAGFFVAVLLIVPLAALIARNTEQVAGIPARGRWATQRHVRQSARGLIQKGSDASPGTPGPRSGRSRTSRPARRLSFAGAPAAPS